MKAPLSLCLGLIVLILLALSWSAVWTEAAHAKARSAPAAASTNAVQALIPAEIPKSIFTIPASPSEGRNPFFPQSAPQPPSVDTNKNSRTGKPALVDLSGLMCNGLTPNGVRRTVMINSHTFEEGESAEVKLPNGTKVLVKCEEIKNDAVVVTSDGQRRELKYRFGL